jgi:hypothetical protein
VSWKSELKLADLDATVQIEITCKNCGLMHYETPPEIMDRGRFQHAYLDEVEHALRCKDRHCNGAVRISLNYDDQTEGFVGGMA